MDDCYDPRQRKLRFGVQNSIWKNLASKLPFMVKLERLELDRVRNFTSLRHMFLQDRVTHHKLAARAN